uniref:C-type lectin domain-containing protein n=1 Tax=Oreochromis aureus TaxID=47969 RepID=A0A668TX43_OREAU
MELPGRRKCQTLCSFLLCVRLIICSCCFGVSFFPKAVVIHVLVLINAHLIRCYWTKMTWTEAQSYCREHFTDLVTIYNSDINQLLLSISPRINTWVWIGLYDDPYSWKWSMEGKHFYVGSTHEFLIWANGQPDCINANEYCVALQGQTQMNDRPCGDSYPFLFKVPPTAHQLQL